MQTIDLFAGLAAPGTASDADLSVLRSPSSLLHAGGALLLLLVAAALSVYKPRGLTRYGQRKQLDRPKASSGA